MGKIELDHTGSGGAITLSSDGTSLLLGGSAVGGGASAYTFNNQTLDYTVVSSDLGKIISFTGGGSKTATLTSAATLGAGWYCFITSDKSTGGLTIDPDGSETIEAASTFPIKRGQRIQIVSDGTNWFVSDSTFPRGISFDNANNSSQANASGSGAVALGYGSTASGGYTFAAGASSSAAGAVAGTGGGAVALGGSRASGTDSFAAAIANNTSSYGATGANSIAMGVQSKATASSALALGNAAIASGAFSNAIGFNNTASGTRSTALGSSSTATDTDSVAIGKSSDSSGEGSVAIGYNSDASADYSKALGTNCQATATGSTAIGEYARASGASSFVISTDITGDGTLATASQSIAIGANSKSDVIGKIAHSSKRFAANGDAQGGIFVLLADTTDATATVLTTNNSTAAATNQIVAASDTCITFDGTITAMQNGAQAYASWKIEGLLVNDGGTTTLANSATTVIQNLSSWGMALSADNTNNALAITVTGEASHNIRWVANIRTTEVTYA